MYADCLFHLYVAVLISGKLILGDYVDPSMIHYQSVLDPAIRSRPAGAVSN